MKAPNLLKAAIFTLVVVLIFTCCWELYWRSQGLEISYNDDAALWADKRARIPSSTNNQVVFIGSSRIKYDLDIPIWEKLTGTKAVQLACVGTNPRPILDDLAEDKNFHGRLVIDVTEGLFFSPPEGSGETGIKNIAYYKKRTPTQRASFQINHLLESQFVFLDRELSLDALLNKLKIKDRPGVYGGPDFPIEFNRVTFQRQSYMNNKFLADTNLQNRVREIWASFGRLARSKPPQGDTLQKILTEVKASIDKIKSRGGTVIFVRTPSSGPYLQKEMMAFPKTKYWDPLLAATGCPGIHFQDYPQINHYICPEFSHLKRSDAIEFTGYFVQILKSKGWQFEKPAVAMK